jgi:hypothetical protein
MQLYDAQKWRNERYFNEECDTLLKLYRDFLQNIY